MLFFLFAPEFRFTQIFEAFEVEMGQQPRLQRRFIVFSPNSVVSAFEIAFFPKFPFRCSALFFLRQNSSSNKLVQLFDWKQVTRSDSVRGSSFFGQILSFRPPKWHFYENFRFGGRIFFIARIQFQANQCNFSIGNRLTRRTPSQNHRLSANLYRFGLRIAIF